MEKLLTNSFFKQVLNFFVLVVVAFVALLGISKFSHIFAQEGGASIFHFIEEVN
jgi:lipopolysaccharide export LptBFGC system permease protein LptF